MPVKYACKLVPLEIFKIKSLKVNRSLAVMIYFIIYRYHVDNTDSMLFCHIM